MKRKITLKHIARELDVSISTVSKALKNSPEISKDTREKVQAFAKLYNYKPNNIAISLKNKRTRNIGVLIPDIVHHFFTTVFRGIEQYANARGYNVIICDVTNVRGDIGESRKNTCRFSMACCDLYVRDKTC